MLVADFRLCSVFACLVSLLVSVSWSWADDPVLYEISGTVTHRIDGSPLAGVLVSIQEARGDRYSTATDSNGFYRFEVPAGFYGAWTAPDGYQGEKYDDIPCSLLKCDQVGGILLNTDDAPHRGIDFALDALSKIQGKVTSEGTGTPSTGIEGATVVVGNPALDVVATAVTGPDGSYEVGLTAGDYYLAVYAPGHRSEAYDDVPCSEPLTRYFSCPTDGVETLSIPELNQIMTGIDIALEPAGSISGRVTDSANGQGLATVQLAFTEVDGDDKGFAITDEKGEYRSTGLTGSSYYVEVIYFYPYIPEIYDDVTCYLDKYAVSCPRNLATPVTVDALADTPNVDFQLDEGGSITGTITDVSSGLPLQWTYVYLFHQSDGTYAGVRRTGEQGRYVFEGLWEGNYYLRVFNLLYIGELYREIPCLHESPCFLEQGDSVRVERQAETSGIDFTLDPLGEMSGRVTDRLTGAGLAGIEIEVWRAGSLTLAPHKPITDAQGFFTVPWVEPGEYVLRAQPFDPADYVPALSGDVDCPSETCDLSTGERIEITSGNTEQVQITLRPVGVTGIAGFLTDRLSGIGVPHGKVALFDVSGEPVSERLGAADGSYRFDGLPAGQYFLIAGGDRTVRHLYGSGDCDDSDDGDGDDCDPLFGTPIVLGSDDDLAVVSLDLQATQCLFPGLDLCLGENGRFRTLVKWQDTAGANGFGASWGLTSDSGVFSYFNADNIEGIVKVLDACDGPSHRYWVFAAGLTDVQTTLWVTDLASREIRVYENPQGRAFLPIQDTEGFDSCGVSAFGGGADTASQAFDLGTSQPPSTPPTKNCPGSSGELCLNDGRFSVRAFYRVAGGPERTAAAVDLTDDSGYFWFFHAANVEVLIKVLDACLFSDRFWVFAAGLTDVEVRLEVTDTDTGQTGTYTNNQGNAFQPIQDTQAFNVCF